MPDWSRRRLLQAGCGVGAAGVLGGWWYSEQRPFCTPLVDPWWTHRGEHWTRPVALGEDVLVGEGYGATGGSEFRLARLESGTGQAQWARTFEGGGVGVPTTHDGRVYVGTGLDTVHAFDAVTGSNVWSYDPGGVEEYGGGAWPAPLVADGRVYVGVSYADDPNVDPGDESQFTHAVTALDATDGSEAWTTEVTSQVWADPIHVAGVVVCGSEDGVLRGFDPATGAVRWELSLPSGLHHRPVVTGNESLTLVTDDGTAVHVDVPEGTIRRTKKPLRGATAVAHDDDSLYVGGESGRVVSLPVSPLPDVQTWPSDWTYDVGVRVGDIATSEEELLVVDQSGHLHRVGAAGHRKERRRLVDRNGDRCGWRPDRHYITGARFDGRALTVTSRWWVRSYSIDDA